MRGARGLAAWPWPSNQIHAGGTFWYAPLGVWNRNHLFSQILSPRMPLPSSHYSTESWVGSSHTGQGSFQQIASIQISVSEHFLISYFYVNCWYYLHLYKCFQKAGKNAQSHREPKYLIKIVGIWNNTAIRVVSICLPGFRIRVFKPFSVNMGLEIYLGVSKSPNVAKPARRTERAGNAGLARGRGSNPPSACGCLGCWNRCRKKPPGSVRGWSEEPHSKSYV